MTARDSLFKSSYPITLDGNEYSLRYRAFAYITYLEQTGGDLLREFEEVGKAMREGHGNSGRFFKYVCDALWVGMLEAHPEIKREDIPRMFGFQELKSVLETLGVALTGNLPAPRPTMPIVEIAIEPRHDSVETNGNGYTPASELNAVSVSPSFSDSVFAISPI
jgi:hypothetical protein